MKKIIGNTLLVLAFVVVAIVAVADVDHDTFSILGLLYAFCLIGGIVLRIGDFFKWRAKKHAEGFQEAAQQKASRYCSKCGSGLTADTVFCPKCGNKVS
ncbi:MAG: zinc ribbon domain-containing protein [Ruminococcaceae bacterium]|nr:zinc ribbon domain-containing protein [Oscillospiraceae bacterium]